MQVVIKPGILAAQVDDGATGMHYGGVIAPTEGVAYLRKAV